MSSDPNRIMYAIDPGETTGWAKFQGPDFKDMGQVPLGELHKWLDSLNEGATFVIENFRIRPGVKFTWSEVSTIRVIGAIVYRAHQINAVVVFQEPAVKTIGSKWSGTKPVTNHDHSHQQDAYFHGVYFNTKILGYPIPAVKLKYGERSEAKPS